VALTEFRHGRKGGELKHGPIARRVMVIAPHDRVFEKTVSNMQEIATLGGRIILVTIARARSMCLSYGRDQGLDADQRRDLAKSVKVE
jgi:glucosamine 6-phosphate synthetase-like amidotransferase/phosphosugar isomerase protein